MSDWKKIAGREVYRNPWYSVEEHNVLRPDGKKGVYGVLQKISGCRIIGIDNDNKIIFIKIQNYPCNNQVFLEVPGGNNRPGVSESKQAQNEFFEETGLVAGKVEKIGRLYQIPRISGTYDNVFVATKLSGETDLSKQEGDEGIKKVLRYSKKEVLGLINDGMIVDGITLGSLMILFSKEKFCELFDK